MEESGDALEASVAALVSDSEDNIFTQARESGNTSSVKKQAKEFVSDYNSLIKNLTSSTSTLDSYYRKILEELSTDNADELSSIGISIDKKGYLSLNESKFDSADIDTLEEILGSKSTYMTRVGYVAGRVSAQAESNLESLTTQYSSNGLDYTSYTSSKYSYWG
jgi:flagellar capping protein FliD